jgi:hypothetical protein
MEEPPLSQLRRRTKLRFPGFREAADRLEVAQVQRAHLGVTVEGGSGLLALVDVPYGQDDAGPASARA